MPPTETFGTHLMLDGYGADPALLADGKGLTLLLHDLPRALGMHPIAEPLVVEVGPKNRKDPGGLSGFVLIAESHISFHTFPTRGFVTIDVYTCQSDIDRDRMEGLLTQGFGIRSCDVFIQPRGLRYPTVDHAPVNRLRLSRRCSTDSRGESP